MGRPRHPKKDLELVLKEAESRGWKASKGRKYFTMLCRCGSHQKTVRLSPSGANYEKNLRGWLKRTGCWEDR